jgi:hypothetical protein
MDTVSSVLAIVDAHDSDPVVWWANLGPSNGMFRLCGAWVLDTPELRDKLADLIAGRALLTTIAGRAALTYRDIPLDGHIDVVTTHHAVLAWRDELQTAYEKRAAHGSAGKGLIAPRWPDIPELLNVEDITAVAGDPRACRALGIARWFDTLCFAWDSIEGQRLARPYLREHGGEVARTLPVAYANVAVPA